MLESLLGGQSANGNLLFLIALLCFAVFVYVLSKLHSAANAAWTLLQIYREGKRFHKTLDALRMDELEPCPACGLHPLPQTYTHDFSSGKIPQPDLSIPMPNFRAVTNNTPCSTCRGRGVLLRSRN